MITHAEALTVAALAAVALAAVVTAFALALLGSAWRGRGQHKADVAPVRITLTPRRALPVAAGGAPGRAPSAGAPEAPALAPRGAGASPQPRPGDPPWGSGARSGPGQPRPAAPEEAAPASPGAVPERPSGTVGNRVPWVITQDPPGTPRGQRPFSAPLHLAVLPGGAWDGSRIRELAPPTVPADGPEARGRQTGAQPALVRPGRARFEAWQDEAVNVR